VLSSVHFERLATEAGKITKHTHYIVSVSVVNGDAAADSGVRVLNSDVAVTCNVYSGEHRSAIHTVFGIVA
jgi:hypothetical protein